MNEKARRLRAGSFVIGSVVLVLAILFFLGGITLLKQSEELQDRRLPTRHSEEHKSKDCHVKTLLKTTTTE